MGHGPPADNPAAGQQHSTGPCPLPAPVSFVEITVGLQLRPPELELEYAKRQAPGILASDKQFGLLSFLWLFLLHAGTPTLSVQQHPFPHLAPALLALQAAQLALLHHHPRAYLRVRPLITHAIWALHLLNTLAAAHTPACAPPLPHAGAPAVLLIHNLLVHSLTFQSASFNLSIPTALASTTLRTFATLLAALTLQAPAMTSCTLLHPRLAPLTTPLLHASHLLQALVATTTSHPLPPTLATPSAPTSTHLHLLTHTWLIFSIAALPLAYLYHHHRSSRRLFAIRHLSSTPTPTPTRTRTPTLAADPPSKPPPPPNPTLSDLTYTPLTLTAERFEHRPGLNATDIGLSAVLLDCAASPLLQCLWLLPPLLLLSATAAMALGALLPGPLPLPPSAA